VGRLSQPVSLGTTVALVLVAVLLATGASAALTAFVIKGPGQGEPGPPGPRGERGPPGPQGRPGQADSRSVFGALEGHPARTARLIQDNVRPSPAELQRSVSRIRRQLAGICRSFALKSCPG
jgi:hypothetical protein